MNKRLCPFATVILAVCVAQADDSGQWNTANNSVTYSASANNIPLGQGGLSQINLSQFDTSVAALREGAGTSTQYTLLSAVLSLDGSIYGYINFYNNSTGKAYPKLSIDGSAYLYFGSDYTAAETYQTVNLGTVQSGQSLENFAVQSEGTSGSVSTPSITADLQRFLGSGTISTYADFTEIVASMNIGNDQSGSISLAALANASVTYYYTYDPVPEPTSLSLVVLGCAAVLARRRKPARSQPCA